MYNLTLAMGIFLSILIALLLGAILGRRFGEWQIAHHPSHKIEIVSIAEGAVFALLGLLIAFTFTGAYERFEARKLYIIDEANAAETVYLRIGMLAQNTQAEVKDTLKQYLDARIAIYKNLPDFAAASISATHAELLHMKLWSQALAASQTTNQEATTMLLLPSINTLFDIANKRLAVTRIHPPAVVFWLLIGLAVLSSFLAGYSMAKSRNRYSIHILGYILITALIIYIIIDLEMPRIGMIRVNDFDPILVDARNKMY